jgi:hypothetical protein
MQQEICQDSVCNLDIPESFHVVNIIIVDLSL